MVFRLSVLVLAVASIATLGCSRWQDDYQTAYTKAQSVLKDGYALSAPSRDATFGFMLNNCDSVKDRSLRMKDEVSALKASNTDAQKAKDKLLDLLQENAEGTQTARSLIEAMMRTKDERDSMSRAVDEGKRMNIIDQSLSEVEGIEALRNKGAFNSDWRDAKYIGTYVLKEYERAMKQVTPAEVDWLAHVTKMSANEKEFRSMIGDEGK